jgi:hypothetical protein
MVSTTHVRIAEYEHELLKELAEREDEEMSYIVSVLVQYLHDLKYPETPDKSGYCEEVYWDEMDVLMVDSDRYLRVKNL